MRGLADVLVVVRAAIQASLDRVCRGIGDLDQRPEGGGWLLLVDYPDDAAAELAEDGATEVGIAIRRKGARLAAVLAPEPQAAGDSLLAEAIGGE